MRLQRNKGYVQKWHFGKSVMKATRVRTSLALVALTAVSLNAALIPGRWEKVAALEQGYPIIVTLKGWERIKGTFDGLDTEGLLIKKENKQKLALPKASVIQVESQDRTNNDSLINGPMWGAILGAGFSALGMTLSSDDIRSNEAAAVIALSAGLGAGIGFVGDALIKTPEIFYEAPKK